MPKLTPYDKAIRAAARKLPFLSRKQMSENLEFAADDMVDAYEIGAEEAQREIISRLQELAAKEQV